MKLINIKTIITGVSFALAINLNAQSYSDHSSQSGISYFYGAGEFGGGVSFVDYNRDGLDDITLATSSNRTILVYKNNGNGTFSLDSNMIPSDTTQHKHIIWVDYDNDADYDLYVTSYSAESRLYKNNGDTALVDVTVSAGVATHALDSNPVFGACWGDYNNDGYADLYVTKHALDDRNYLFKNNGNGTFTDVAVSAGADDTTKILAFCAAFIDYNNDGYQDIYISYDRYSQQNTLLRNNGNGSFSDVSVSSGANIAVNAMSVGVGDYDNNGYLDIYITNTQQGNKLIKNNGNGTFTEVSAATKCELFGVAWAANFLDYDNDRDWDLYVSGMINQSSKPSSQLYRNNNDSVFALPTNDGLDYDTVTSFSNAIGDFNNDGYPDIAVNNYTPYSFNLWKNNGGNNHWVKFELEGVNDTRDGLGTWIDVYNGGKKYSKYTICGDGFLTQNSTYPILGLGADSTIDSINVRWLDGTIDRYYNQSADKKFKVKQGVTKQPTINWVSKNFIYLCPGDSLIINPGIHTTYKWSTNATDSFIVIKTAGTYNVTVTNEYGFETQSPNLHVIMLDSIKGSIIGTDALCADSNSGSIKVNLTQAHFPLNFQWTGGISGDTIINNVGAGTYNLTITDTAQCFSYTGSVTINEPAALSLSMQTNHNDCYGASVGRVLTQVNGGTMPYSYSWDGVAGVDSLVNLIADTYRLTVTDDNGCAIIDSATVTEPTELTMSITSKDITCFGDGDGEVSASVSGGTGIYDYVWSSGGANTNSRTNLNEGWYIITVSDANNCEMVDSAYVSEPDELLLTMVGNDILCYGDKVDVTFTATGGIMPYSYVWTPGSSTDSIINVGAGTHTVEITDNNGCKNNDAVNLTQPDSITLDVFSSPETTGMGDGFAWVVATGGVGNYTYLWDNNQDNDTAFGLISGLYVVTVTDSNGCEAEEIVRVTKVGVVNLSLVESVSLYPNPTSADAKLLLTSKQVFKASIVLTNTLGQVVTSSEYEINQGVNTIDLNASNLLNGTYLISIISDGEPVAQLRLLVVK